MATTTFTRGSTNDGLIPKKWAAKYLKDSAEKDPLKPFWGGNDSIVTTDYDLTAGAGDTVIIPIVGLPTGAGVTDDGDYDSNIDGLTLYEMPVVVHEHGRSKGLNGVMTEKCAALKTRTLTMDALTLWAGMFRARSVIDALSGMAQHSLGQNVVGASGLTGHSNVTKVAPAYTSGHTAKRYYCGGQILATGVYTGRITDVSGLSAANHCFGTKVIEAVKRMAMASVDTDGTLIDPIMPVNVNGKSLFVMLVSFKQGRDLKADPTWRNGHYYADIRGLENSIFSGQLGVWDGVMVIETDLLHTRTGAASNALCTTWFDVSAVSVASGVTANRALFMGQSSVAWAWGKAPEYKEFYADHAQTKWAARVTSIYGVMKVCKYSTGTTPAVVPDSAKGVIAVDTAVG